MPHRPVFSCLLCNSRVRIIWRRVKTIAYRRWQWGYFLQPIEALVFSCSSRWVYRVVLDAVTLFRASLQSKISQVGRLLRAKRLWMHSVVHADDVKWLNRPWERDDLAQLFSHGGGFKDIFCELYRLRMNDAWCGKFCFCSRSVYSRLGHQTLMLISRHSHNGHATTILPVTRMLSFGQQSSILWNSLYARASFFNTFNPLSCSIMTPAANAIMMFGMRQHAPLTA